ncbi:MAG: hypothetical protein ACRD19_14225 [Terriglobia bacterium]
MLVALAWLDVFTVKGAQISQRSTTPESGVALFLGEISIGGDLLAKPIQTESFTCTPLQLIKGGEKLRAVYEITEGRSAMWSISKRSLQVGTRQVAYPIDALVTTSDGVGHGLVPAILRAKTNIEPGEMLHSGEYQIETNRALKAGDSVPVLFIAGDDGAMSIMSIETGANGKPWFAAYKNIKLHDRASFVETWRLAKQYVARGF